MECKAFEGLDLLCCRAINHHHRGPTKFFYVTNKVEMLQLQLSRDLLVADFMSPIR
jgi:hypothetical protein